MPSAENENRQRIDPVGAGAVWAWASVLLPAVLLAAACAGEVSGGENSDAAFLADASDATAAQDGPSSSDAPVAADADLDEDAAPVGPSGEPMPVGDLPGWRQIFTDDFTTDVPLGSFPAAVAAKWSAYPDGWHDTSGNGTYSPSTVISVQDGMMNLHLHTEDGVHMVSAPVPKLPDAVGSGGGLLYGRYTIRFRADPVPGYKTAWLLWPDSEDWPQDGEIDFPEGDLDGTISAFMHRQDGTSGGDQDAYSTSATYPPWHTAVIEWTAAQCRFILDGDIIGTSTSRIPSTPMHWVIQTETSLGGSEPDDAAEGDVQIDWVAVYVPE